MKIVMEIGKDTYIGMNGDRMLVAVSRDKAIEFDHAYDICQYINRNRKSINRFLQRNHRDMKLTVERPREETWNYML